MEIVIRNNQRLIKINQRKVKKVIRTSLNHLASRNRKVSSVLTHSLPPLEVSVLFVSDRKMRDLNFAYRGLDKTTDVLSFPQMCQAPGVKRQASYSLDARLFAHDALRTTQLGDIVISPRKAEKQAKENRVSVQHEISWLLIHGLLHLLGLDHEKNRYQAGKMRKIEKELLGIVCR